MTGPGGLKEAGTAVVSRGEGRVRAPCWGYDFAAFSGPPLPPSAVERKIIGTQSWIRRLRPSLVGGYVMQTRTARALALLSCLAPVTAALDSSASALWAALNTVSIGSAPSL